MATSAHQRRVIQVFRYDPTRGGDGHYDRFEMDVAHPNSTTMLDILIRIQREQDPSVAFRYACRVNMCGSCGMVINGREGLACKTNVCDLPPDRDITLRPLNHFPVVKDLVVDMTPFFKKYEDAMPFFSPRTIEPEPAVIPPDARERQDIGLATECIQCGCCVSSCSMVNYHDGYAGPAALNRAFTLLADSREGRNAERLRAVLQSCYNCRTEFNCTEVCPKELSPTRAIKYIQRLALKHLGELSRPAGMTNATEEPAPPVAVVPFEPVLQHAGCVAGACSVAAAGGLPDDPSRRQFFRRVIMGIGAASALGVGGLLATAAVGPTLTKTPGRWIPISPMDDLAPAQVSTVTMRYEVTSGFHKETVVKPVMICRRADVNNMVVFNTTCTHLGCTVRWDAGKNIYVCACHGGQFDHEGRVIAGPPPRPLDTYRFKVENGCLMVEVV
ncbi:MAG: Rieske 2Fe-2S domain-containing protein [Deltaproteobacteria bacterium]|nr:Rieske 2Fe-2S domain-containing protein [Deltaproteobacteria bacterium]